MNKVVKVVSILLIAIMLTTVLSQTILAADTAIDNFSGKGTYESTDLQGFSQIAVRVLTAVRNIAIIAAVLIISILGVKYMIGSVEEKAGYKKAFMPLIVGAILVVAAAQIAKMLFSLGAQ